MESLNALGKQLAEQEPDYVARATSALETVVGTGPMADVLKTKVPSHCGRIRLFRAPPPPCSLGDTWHASSPHGDTWLTSPRHL